MEIVTALAILTIAVIPILSLHIVNIKHSRQLYYRSVVNEMLNDRIRILRQGGWEKFGLCNRRKIDFIGEAAGELPQGEVLLSVENFKEHESLLKITLSWKVKRRKKFREIRKETIVFVPDTQKAD